MQVRLEIGVVRAVGHLAQIHRSRTHSLDIGRFTRDGGYRGQGPFGLLRHIRHAVADHGAIQRRSDRRHDLLALVAAHGVAAYPDGTLALRRHVRDAHGGRMDHTHDRARMAVLVELEQ